MAIVIDDTVGNEVWGKKESPGSGLLGMNEKEKVYREEPPVFERLQWILVQSHDPHQVIFFEAQLTVCRLYSPWTYLFGIFNHFQWIIYKCLIKFCHLEQKKVHTVSNDCVLNVHHHHRHHFHHHINVSVVYIQYFYTVFWRQYGGLAVARYVILLNFL